MNEVVLSPEESERVREGIRDGVRERAFWSAHRSELRAKYPNKVVAVKDSKVVAVVDELFDMPAALSSLGLTPPETWIEYMRTEPKRWAL